MFVYPVVCFLLGDSPASDLYMPTFRNTLSVPSSKAGVNISYSYIRFIIIIGGILALFVYITRLASNEIFLPSNKIHREVGQAKDLSAPRFCY